jgi:geranylgeranyl transferase type-1 subunit beta
VESKLNGGVFLEPGVRANIPSTAARNPNLLSIIDDMEDSKLHVQLHTKYWQRCLKSLLPTQYTSNDSSRMALAFFILSALDLLGAGPSTFPPQERANIRDWILRCQHPNGGFCGSPNHRFPDAFYIDVGNGTQQMDPANLPATFFAILSLTFVGNLEGVKRNECLRWLKKVQREDGSFGELVTQEGRIIGGRDMRYCYVATAVRWMLRGGAPLSEREKEEDINVEALVVHLQAGQVHYCVGAASSMKADWKSDVRWWYF